MSKQRRIRKFNGSQLPCLPLGRIPLTSEIKGMFDQDNVQKAYERLMEMKTVLEVLIKTYPLEQRAAALERVKKRHNGVYKLLETTGDVDLIRRTFPKPCGMSDALARWFAVQQYHAVLCILGPVTGALHMQKEGTVSPELQKMIDEDKAQEQALEPALSEARALIAKQKDADLARAAAEAGVPAA